MGTFVQIQTRVKRRVIDLPASVTAEVPELVNEAIRSLETRHDFKVMETESSTFTTTVAIRSIGAVPSDFKKLRGRPFYVRNDGSIRRLLNPHARMAAERTFTRADANDKGKPALILDAEPDKDGARNFEVYPFPDGSSDYSGGEYRIIVPYWRFLADLSADADTNWFTVNAEEYVIFAATSEAFFLDWDEERAQIWSEKATQKANEIILADKHFRMAGVSTIVPHRDVNAPRLRG